MQQTFSFLTDSSATVKNIEAIDDAIKIVLGPTGKNGLFCTNKNEIKFLTSGSLILKNLELNSFSGNVLKKLFEQSALKTSQISGDGSTTTVLLSCQLLKASLRLLANGYSKIFLSNGLKKLAYFFLEKIVEFSVPIQNQKDLFGIMQTSLGKRMNSEIFYLLKSYLSNISRDGLILVEENSLPISELELVQGIELDKGFASSYFINDVANFQVIYDQPYVLVANDPIDSLNQITEVINFIKTTSRPLVIVADDISKDIISTLVLNSIQKKLKVVVIKYNSIKFIKTGILEDLATLTHSTYFSTQSKNIVRQYFSKDLGQAEKVIIKKEKSTFLISKFSKLIAKRKINELNRELLISETDYEKTIYKTRIARLSGNMAKLKIGTANQYQIQEERQKIENVIKTLHSSLEEGVLPGGGIFYLSLQEEMKNWSYLNLIGEEIFSVLIVNEALSRPFNELCHNTNNSKHFILKQIRESGYPYAFNFLEKKLVNVFEFGLLDSAKTVRGILWNSLTMISTIITSD